MNQSRFIALPIVSAAGFALALASPGDARGQEPRIAVSPGLSLGVSFGVKTAFSLGLDVRQSFVFQPDSSASDNRVGVGVFAQVSWLNFSAWRFAAGAHGGGEILSFALGAEGEVGWTYRTDYHTTRRTAGVGPLTQGIIPGAHGLHLGLLTTGFPGEELAVRVAIPFSRIYQSPETTISLGARYPNPWGHTDWDFGHGRPLRDMDGCPVTPAVIIGSPRPSPRSFGLDAVTRAALANAWLDDARAECASVPAFLALARDLRRVGAPPSFVARALDAVEDERAHTALCSELAGDYAGVDLRPAPIASPPPSDANRTSALARLAVESWLDGCVGERAAAMNAARARVHAEDARARYALEIIARDEARHAALGRDVMAWCAREGGRAVDRALDEALSAPIGALDDAAARPADVDSAAWRAHGRSDRASANAGREEAFARARREAELILR